MHTQLQNHLPTHFGSYNIITGINFVSFSIISFSSFSGINI